MYISKVDMLIKAAQLYGEDHPRLVANKNCSGTTGIVTVQQLVDDGKVKKDDTKKSGTTIVVEDPYSGNDMVNLKLCVYKDNNRVYAKVTGCSGNKWMANGVDLPSGYC